MEDFNLIISVASFIGVCVFIAMAWNHSKLIKQMQNDIINNNDALHNRIRNSEDACDRASKWRNELMKKKYDDLCDSHSKLDNRVCDLASRVWSTEGSIDTLHPYIKRLGLKHLIKTSGSINKGAIKELKEIENELK
jgi:hypothetical protein